MMSKDKDITAALPAVWKMVPIEPTSEILSAMACSKAHDDEGEFPAMLDLLDFSGENKTHTVLRAAYAAAVAAAPAAPSPAPVPESQAGVLVEPTHDSERPKFERYYREELKLTRNAHGHYLSAFEDHLWGAWWAKAYSAYNEARALAPSAAPVAAESEGWISVDERMPAEWDMVLTCGSKKVDQAVMAWSEHDGWQIETANDWRSAYAPTHWRQLPPLPTAPLTAPKG